MSVDALLFTSDKALALRELARVLRPGGRLALLELLLDASDELADERGTDRPAMRAELEEMHATLECMTLHVFVLAVRTT